MQCTYNKYHTYGAKLWEFWVVTLGVRGGKI